MGTRRLRAAGAAVLLAIILSHIAIYEDAGAEDEDWSKWLGAPGPEECQADPRSAEDLVYALATVAAEPRETVVPAQIESVNELPAGRPATATEAAGALDTVRELLACLNAGSYGSVLALFSDDALVRLIWGSGPVAPVLSDDEINRTIGMIASIVDVAPTPLSVEQRANLIEIREVRLLPDGRILVIVVGTLPLAGGLAFAILEESGDRWLIAVFGTLAPPGTPTSGS